MITTYSEMICEISSLVLVHSLHNSSTAAYPRPRALCLLTQGKARTRAGDAESQHHGFLATLDVEMFMTVSRGW
jgi:hypothetical protein